MILYIASALVFIFVAFNLFWRANLPLAVKAGGCLLLLGVSLKYEIYRFLGGWFFAPQLPREFLIIMEALYGALLILFFLLLFYDLYLLGNWLLGRAGLPVPRHLPLGAIRGSLVAVALALGCWGTWQAIKIPDVRVVELKLPHLPPSLDGLRLAQLSDLHIGPILQKDWLAGVVARTNAEKPDLILLTGDYVDGHVENIGPELAPLAGLNAPYGVWAVTGNHEYYWNMPQWREALEHLHVQFLENEQRVLNINGATVVVAGIPDPAAERFGLPGPDLAMSLADAPARILLSHHPKNGRDYADQADLMLSGHTHGGIMFFLQPLVARFNAGLVAGLYQHPGGGSLYVNPGTGLWNGFSCRLGVPAEITLFVLK